MLLSEKARGISQKTIKNHQENLGGKQLDMFSEDIYSYLIENWIEANTKKDISDN